MGGNGLVIRSPDRGENWSSSSPGTGTLNAVHFVSDLDGWAVGNGGIVLGTDDGGDSWMQTTPATVNLNGVWFVDADHGWVVGDGGKLLRTVNGGVTWTTSAPTTAALYAVMFIDADTGWAAGKGVVLRTVNGGVSWTAAAPSTATLRGVSFVDANNGFVVGANGLVLKTVNGGANWSASSPSTSSLNAVSFVDAMHGWAVGFSGSVIRTADGGATWDEQRPVTAELRAVQFLDDRFGWAAGTGGTVLRTVDGGDTWVASNPAGVALNGIDFASIPTGVSVTVGCEPSDRTFTVDGTDYTSTQTFVWEPGSQHTIATVVTQDGATGTRHVWQNWSDGGAASHNVSPDANATYTAHFQTQHQLTVLSGGNGTVTPPGAWYPSGAAVTIGATPDPGYGFNGWSGSGSGSYSGWANPAMVTLNGPVTETAAFGTTVLVALDCVPVGRAFVVDGVTYSASQQFTWTPGSSHTVDVPSPQDATADTRYVFSRWSDGGAANHTVAPVGNMTLTATLRAQYTLTVTAGPGGTVSMVDGWYDAGSSATLTASPDSGYSFQRWVGSGSGAYTGGANPKTIIVNGPVTQQALFVAGSVSATPSILTLLGNAPNPFRTETDIRFGLPVDTEVRIELFDVTGRRLLSDTTAGTTGWQSYHLDARAGGTSLRSGIYFVRVTAAGSARTTRILLLR